MQLDLLSNRSKSHHIFKEKKTKAEIKLFTLVKQISSAMEIFLSHLPPPPYSEMALAQDTVIQFVQWPNTLSRLEDQLKMPHGQNQSVKLTSEHPLKAAVPGVPEMPLSLPVSGESQEVESLFPWPVFNGNKSGFNCLKGS